MNRAPYYHHLPPGHQAQVTEVYSAAAWSAIGELGGVRIDELADYEQANFILGEMAASLAAADDWADEDCAAIAMDVVQYSGFPDYSISQEPGDELPL